MKIENEISYFLVESKLQSIIGNIEYGESRRRFTEFIAMRVTLCRGKVAKGESYIKLQIENQARINVKNRDKLCGFSTILAFLQPPRYISKQSE